MFDCPVVNQATGWYNSTEVTKYNVTWWPLYKSKHLIWTHINNSYHVLNLHLPIKAQSALPLTLQIQIILVHHTNFQASSGIWDRCSRNNSKEMRICSHWSLSGIWRVKAWSKQQTESIKISIQSCKVSRVQTHMIFGPDCSHSFF